MGELFIHIGSHKTGTTSIQKACSTLPDADVSGPVKYLNVRPSGGNRVVETSVKLASFSAQIRLDAADQVFRPGEQDRFVTSDETFFWINEPETVHQFATMLQERFSAVTILCYLRRQDLLAVSHQKQIALGAPATRFYGVQATPLPEYQPHFQNYFNYAEKLSTVWASAFGKENINVISYDSIAGKGQDVVEDFANRTGAPLDMTTPIRSNRSMEGNKTLVGLKLMEMGVPKPKRRKILKALTGAGKFLPSRAQAQAFLAHFEEANRQLALDWEWDGAPFAFDQSFDMYPEANNACWSDYDVEQIVHSIIESMRRPNAD